MFGKRKPSGNTPSNSRLGGGSREPKAEDNKTPRGAAPSRPVAQPAPRQAPPIANTSVNNPIAGITAPSRGANGHAGNGQAGQGQAGQGQTAGAKDNGGDTLSAKDRDAAATSRQSDAESPRHPEERREPTPMTGESEGKKLIVGRDIRLAGEITTCDTLVVEGQVEANLTDSKMLEIAESGIFKGKASVEVAEIGGLFEGELTVSQHLRLLGSGRINGKLRYREMEVARGGRLSGDIAEMDGSKAPAVEARPQPAESERQVTPDSDSASAQRSAPLGNGAR